MADICVEKRENSVNIPNCCYEVHSPQHIKHLLQLTLTHSLSYLGPRTPQDYGTGFLTNYTKDAGQAWLKAFVLQTGTAYKGVHWYQQKKGK